MPDIASDDGQPTGISPAAMPAFSFLLALARAGRGRRFHRYGAFRPFYALAISLYSHKLPTANIARDCRRCQAFRYFHFDASDLIRR